MPMTPIELHDVAITLENEHEFHDKYKARAPDLCHGGRRDLIGTLVGKLIPYRGQSPRTTAEDREQLRRYFDDSYNMPCTVAHKAGGVYGDMSGLPDIEFWLDSVKYPEPVKPKRKPHPPEDFLADVPGTVEVPLHQLQQEVADHLTQAANTFSNLANNLKEIIMNKTEIITIETKTLINGVDITTFKDSEIYSLIAAQEAEIDTLDKIKTKPKKLVAEIEKRKAGIEALVAYLDSKE